MSRSTSKSRSRKRSQRFAPSIRLIIGLLVLLLLGYAVQQGYISLEDAGLDDPPPLVYEDGDGSLQVFFTTPYLVYPDVPANRRPPPLETALIADIDNAQQSVDVAVFEYNLPGIRDALVRAAERGVRVRLALDEENLEKPAMAEWAGQIEQAGIPIAWEERTAFLHSKFVIVDEALVWMGSWNMTTNDTYRNNNNMLRITLPLLVANYSAEFAQMADGIFGNDKDALAPNPIINIDSTSIENYFSPQDRQAGRLVELLQDARSSIHFLAFSFTSDEIGQAMLDRLAAGVTVQGVFEKRNAGGTGSEFDMLQQGGVDVWEDGNCYTMHHKVIIIDEQIVITGSYNFTGRAEETNDENLVIIDDPNLAREFMAEFERVYDQARNPVRCSS